MTVGLFVPDVVFPSAEQTRFAVSVWRSRPRPRLDRGLQSRRREQQLGHDPGVESAARWPVFAVYPDRAADGRRVPTGESRRHLRKCVSAENS